MKMTLLPPRTRVLSALLLAGALAAGALLPAVAAQAAGDPDFTIVTPKAGATVTSPVQLTIKVVNAEIGKPTDGLDHLHVSVDNGPAQPMYENRVVSVDLPAGQHTIAVDLAGPTHAPLLPPKSVTFTVK